MCLWWRGTDSGCSGCWQEDWCCGLDNISPVRGCYRLQSCLYSLGHYRWLCARWHACVSFTGRGGTSVARVLLCSALICSRCLWSISVLPASIMGQVLRLCVHLTPACILFVPSEDYRERAPASKTSLPVFFSSAHPTRAQSSLAQQSLQSPSQFDYICD